MSSYFKSDLLPILLLGIPTSLNPLHIQAALHGTPSWTSILLYSLGMQTPLEPSAINKTEYPACAALTTGYVFRVENQATVYYLQRISQTGALTHLRITPPSDNSARSSTSNQDLNISFHLSRGWIYIPAFLLLSRLFSLADLAPASIAAILSITSLLLSRLLTTFVLRSQTQPKWHGAPEPGVHGSLLILLSQDRWVRLSGLVDDLKALTSGSWLTPVSTRRDEFLLALASLLVYAAAVLLASATDQVRVWVVGCVLASHCLVCVENVMAKELLMHGRVVHVDTTKGERGVKRYGRRLEMADELIKETGRRDWAVRLGMVGAEPKEDEKKTGGGEEVATM